MFITLKRLSFILFLSVILTGCKIELYSGLAETEANDMLSILLAEGIAAEKQPGKEQTVAIKVPESQVAESISLLKAKGYPKEKFASIKEIFPQEGLISSPTEEKARLVYALSQGLAETLTQIDGVVTARVHVVLPKAKQRKTESVTPSSVAVFIKHHADVDLSSYIPQIKLLVNNSIEGLDYDKISVVLFPTAQQETSSIKAKMTSALGVSLAKNSQGVFWGWLSGLLLLLLLSNVGWWLKLKKGNNNQQAKAS
ncbi:type III secretion system inner membrane ring lipoprotein SctJ [Spartinivicinus marinus]|uniref:type III secretion system inner membrane ring lipoprotein SctJ n=1 Tax=Spartinivicinus marinus TaxID=2994442 RepID=UPI002258E95A|nr:type III secretion inner membrane ring lipoprotein SctJ [Spartinivicinus marinus]